MVDSTSIFVGRSQASTEVTNFFYFFSGADCMGIQSLQSQQVLKAADGVRNRASQVVVGQISAQDNDL